jgi:hypothetical protein
MVDDNKTGKRIARTIALPALLVISLLTARLVMYSKTGRINIRLSAPIELNMSGLSVSLPSGNGWQCEEKWRFENSSFTIYSIFTSRLKSRTYAQCRYLLAGGTETPEERLGQNYYRIKVATSGQLTENDITVNWASANTNSGDEIILGICELADGRQLEIEILQGASELNTAHDIFEKIVKSIKFSDNGLLQAGARLISGIRDKGLDAVIGDLNKPQSSLFTIADSSNKIIGFAMDAIVLAKKDAGVTINAADYYYLRGTINNEQVGLFRGSDDLRQFVWRFEISSRTGKKGIEMTADSGTLNIRKLRTGSPFDRPAGSDTGSIELGETAVPEIVLEPVLTDALSGREKSFIIDLISSEGDITPVYIEIVPPSEGQTDSNSIKLEWLDGRGYRQQNYYDNSGNPFKKVLKQETTFTINSADVNEVAKLFPEHADIVSKKQPLINRE